MRLSKRPTAPAADPNAVILGGPHELACDGIDFSWVRDKQ
jgi:hypothetical protein